MNWDLRAGLRGRVVVVTGAGGAIGGAVSRGLAEIGALVVGVDRAESRVADVVRELPGNGHRHLHADIGDLGAHRAVFDLARDCGTLRGMAHTAAVLLRQDDVDEITEQDWDLQHSVNLKATFFLDRAAHQVLREQGTPGSIVNFASQSWWTGGVGGSVVYAASKGGVVSLTRGLARSFAADAVRVNAVSPGGVNTPMMHTGLTPDALQGFLSAVPLARLAEPQELVGAVLYLLSDASSYVTGTVLNVSGGQLMY